MKELIFAGIKGAVLGLCFSGLLLMPQYGSLRTQNTDLKAEVIALKNAYDDQRLMTGKMYKALTGVEIDKDSKWLIKEDC